MESDCTPNPCPAPEPCELPWTPPAAGPGGSSLGASCDTPLFVTQCGPGGASALYDRAVTVRCDPATGAQVFVQTITQTNAAPGTAPVVEYWQGGVAYGGVVANLVDCPDVDTESDPVTMCDGGTTTFIRWVVTRNGAPTGTVFDTSIAGAPYTVTGAVTVGPCPAGGAAPQYRARMSGIQAGASTFDLDASKTAGSTVIAYSVTFLTANGSINGVTAPPGTWSWSVQAGATFITLPTAITSTGNFFINWTERV